MIGTVIVSSITVIAIAAFELISLNGAMAYEKKAAQNLIGTIQEKPAITIDYDFDTYSDEASLSAADEMPKEVQVKYVSAKKSFDKILSNRENEIVQKYLGLDNTDLLIVKERLDEKMDYLYNNGQIWTAKYSKDLGLLLAVKDLFY